MLLHACAVGACIGKGDCGESECDAGSDSKYGGVVLGVMVLLVLLLGMVDVNVMVVIMLVISCSN